MAQPGAYAVSEEKNQREDRGLAAPLRLVCRVTTESYVRSSLNGVQRAAGHGETILSGSASSREYLNKTRFAQILEDAMGRPKCQRGIVSILLVGTS